LAHWELQKRVRRADSDLEQSRRTLVIDDRTGLNGYACGDWTAVFNRGQSPHCCLKWTPRQR
jgi:hypothetical protein